MATSKSRVGSFALAAMLSSALFLSACGSSTSETASDPSAESTSVASASESPAETPTPSASATTAGGMPECDALWVDGQKLPRKYKGCLRDGEVVKPVKKMCGFGLPLVEFDNRFYAMAGGPVNDVGDLATSADYQSALTSCQG